MAKIRSWYCEGCFNDYESEIAANECQKKHVDTSEVKIVKARFHSRRSCPEHITIEFRDGTHVNYVAYYGKDET